MKRHASALLALFAASSVFAAGIVCEKEEYARLRDFTKPELIDAFCLGYEKAGIDPMSVANQQQFSDALLRLRRGGSPDARATLSCVAVAEDAADVLRRKFKSPRPTCQ